MKNNHNQKNNQKKPLNKALQLSGISLQMGVTIYLFVLLGKWLDANYNNGNKMYVIITTLSGVAISLYVVLKQTKKLHQ